MTDSSFRAAGAPLTSLTAVDLRALELHANGASPYVALAIAEREHDLTCTPAHTTPTHVTATNGTTFGTPAEPDAKPRSLGRRIADKLGDPLVLFGAWAALWVVAVVASTL